MVFDTTFLIDFEREIKRNQPGKAHQFLTKNPAAPLYISIITAGEFAEGFDGPQQEQCWNCLRHYTILSLDSEVAWLAGQVARQLRNSGTRIGENDVWIAATALKNQFSLVTNNTEHFQRIAGLKLIVY